LVAREIAVGSPAKARDFSVLNSLLYWVPVALSFGLKQPCYEADRLQLAARSITVELYLHSSLRLDVALLK
jgi:hypothetical protein